MKKWRVVHLTSAHPRYDVRIFVKMCSSLAQHGLIVSLIVADGNGDENINGVSIVDVGKNAGGRLARMTRIVREIFLKSLEINADVYHLHDPELIPMGLKLKRMGKIVIFDAHEDLPKQISYKPYLNKITAKMLSLGAQFFEKWSLKKFDAVVSATPYIREKIKRINPKTVDINNYPRLEEFPKNVDFNRKMQARQVTYIGGISRIRGICELVKAMELVDHGITLSLVGEFNENGLRDEVITYEGWRKVTESGWLGRDEVSQNLFSSIAGLVTLHPTINYCDALPVKMFEYMAAGLPVISSDIPLWKSIIDDAGCGICVDPLSPPSIAQAINYLAAHPEKAVTMGNNGRNAIVEKYNWVIEEKKLLSLYEDLLD